MTDMLKVIDVLAESEKSWENAARTIARMGGPDAAHLTPPQSSNWYGSRK
jgi:hypothetical protein